MANARYDWLQALDATNANVYGDRSADVRKDIIRVAGDDYAAAQAAGIIREDGSVDWSKAPKVMGGNAPANSQWTPTGGRAGLVDPWTMKNVTSGYGGTGVYQDPNYGGQVLAQNRAPDDWQMQLGRALATAAFAGPATATLAPLISGGLGLGSGWNSTIGALLKSAPGLAMSGGQNWMSVLGKILGGATGIPGGSTIGGLAGSYAQMTPQQRAALQRSIGG